MNTTAETYGEFLTLSEADKSDPGKIVDRCNLLVKRMLDRINERLNTKGPSVRPVHFAGPVLSMRGDDIVSMVSLIVPAETEDSRAQS